MKEGAHGNRRVVEPCAEEAEETTSDDEIIEDRGRRIFETVGEHREDMRKKVGSPVVQQRDLQENLLAIVVLKEHRREHAGGHPRSEWIRSI